MSNVEIYILPAMAMWPVASPLCGFTASNVAVFSAAACGRGTACRVISKSYCYVADYVAFTP